MNIYYEYEIPDLTRPIPGADREYAPRHHLVPFRPPPARPEDVVGRRLDEISDHVGIYGMGGPGFFGLRFGDPWLVIAVGSAADWMIARGRCVGDSFYDGYDRPRPWMHDGDGRGDELSKHTVGQTVRRFEVQRHSLLIEFENGFDLTIDEAPDRRPVFEGTKMPRAFSPEDDLRRAVFFSPTAEIWV
jgi:hypothetical protein